jgi:hypothetical protein
MGAMTEASLAVQIAIRRRLLTSADLLAIVPANRIKEGPARPEQFPTIIIGDGQISAEPITFSRREITVYSDLHIWATETGLAGGKAIAGLVQAALRARLDSIEEYHVFDSQVSSIRFLRDPDGQHSHAVVSVVVKLQETL